MATIRNTITLSDKMVPVLNNIVRAMNLTITSMEKAKSLSPTMANQIRADLGAAEIALNGFNDELAEIPAKTKKVSEGFTVMRGIVSNMLAGFMTQMVQMSIRSVGVAIQTASSLVEVQNVVDVTFGESADIINSWSKTALNAYGLNELSAKKYAGTMGAMLKSSGLTGDAVNKMSLGLVGLTGDMASFYNLNAEDAFLKIRAGISGETEPLKQLGINMSVANLEAFALKQGMKESYESMSQAEKVLLRYNYLMEVSADSQGDFTRTSESFANQQKVANESWSMFTAGIMTHALPALASMLSAFNGLISVLEPFTPIIATALGILGALAVALLLVTAAQWAWNFAQAMNPINWVIIAVVALIIILAFLIAWIVDVWKTNVDFRVAVIGIWNSILSFFDHVPAFFTRIGNAIADIFSNIKVWVLESLQGMANDAINIVNTMIALLNKIPGVAIEPIKSMTFGAVTAAEEEAKRQSRADNLSSQEAAADASAAKRAAELAQYETDARIKQAEYDAQAAKKGFNMEDYLAGGIELEGGNLDSVGKIKGDVKITDEDIKLLKDIASVEFMNKYTTLRPEMNVTFGDVRETADVNGILDTIVTMVEEAYGSALVGEGA